MMKIKIAWIVMCTLTTPSGEHITTLMQDKHIYANQAACLRSFGYAFLVKYHARLDETLGGNTRVSCVYEKIVP